MKAGLEATDRAKIQRQEVEKQRAVGFSCKADELSLCLRGRRVVDVLEVGRLAAKPGPVINNLAVDFSRCVVDKRQGLYPFTTAPVRTRSTPNRSFSQGLHTLVKQGVNVRFGYLRER